MTLELLVCTIDNGIDNVKNLLLAPIKGVSYLVSWQHSPGKPMPAIPQELLRDDVKIVHLEGKGLSRNRNNAIRNATGDICLIADDDCIYRPEYFNTIINTFHKDSSLDLAAFRFKTECESKNYPDIPYNLQKLHKGHHISSIEIAFRRTSVQGKLWFNEQFGLGAPVLQSCEDNIFIFDAVNSGLNCRYFPYIITEHNHPTTASTRVGNPGVIMAEGAFIRKAYKWTALPRIVLKAYRLNKKNSLGFFKNLSYLFNGVRYLKQHSGKSYTQ